MNTSRVVCFKKLGFFDFLKKNKIILILCLFFIIGVIFGTVFFSKSDTVFMLAKNYFNILLNHRVNKSFLSITISSFISSLISMLICFLCGASLMGVVLVPIFMIWHGIWYGGISAFLYTSYSLKGVAFNAVLIIPSTLISLIAFIFAARESMAFSFVLSGLTLPKSRPLNLNIDFRNYCGRYILLSLVILFSAVIDSILSCSFLHFFNFN